MFDISETTEYSECSCFWWSLYSSTATCIPKDCEFIFFKRSDCFKGTWAACRINTCKMYDEPPPRFVWQQAIALFDPSLWQTGKLEMCPPGRLMVTCDRHLHHLGFQCEVRDNSSSFYLDTLNNIHVQKVALLGGISVPYCKHVIPQPVNQNHQVSPLLVQLYSFIISARPQLLFIYSPLTLARKAVAAFHMTKILMATGWQTRTILLVVGI